MLRFLSQGTLFAQPRRIVDFQCMQPPPTQGRNIQVEKKKPKHNNKSSLILIALIKKNPDIEARG